MAEKTIHVCDFDGKAAVETVQVTTSRGKVELDVCAEHRRVIASGRPVRRGRPKNGTLKTTRVPRARRGEAPAPEAAS